MQKDRIGYIDALRGFAIIGVISTHAVSLAGVSGRWRQVLEMGGYGVQLFFVISACLIFMTYDRALQREQHPVRNFFIRRLLRIVPVYWAGIVLYSAVYGLESRGWRDGPELWHVPTHVTLTNLFFPEAMSSVVPGGWSISCEVIFYMTVPLWFVLIRNQLSALVFFVVAIAIGIATVTFGPALFGDNFAHLPPSLMYQYWYRSFPNQLSIFAVGILLYMVIRDATWLERLQRPAVNLVLIAFALVLVALRMKVWMPLSLHNVCAISFAIIGLCLSQIQWRALVNEPIRFVGRISYSSYLLHFLVLHTLYRLGLSGLPPIPMAAALFVLGTAFTIPLAYVSFRLIEMPATSLARRIIKASDHGIRERAPRPA